MRIGIFTDTYPPFINGVSTSVLMLQKGLEKAGHKVYIVTVNSEKMRYNFENEKIIRIPGIPIGLYDYRLTGIYPLKPLATIKSWNLDVIHSHTEFGVGSFARIIAKQYNIPLVHTYHTMYEDYIHYITKGFFDKSSKKIVEYLTSFYCDKTADALIVPGEKPKDLFKNKYGMEKEVHVVPTGIEIDRFYKENVNEENVNELKRKYGLTKDDFVMLYVGRIALEKNIDFLLDCQKEMLKTMKNLKLVIVGDGPDAEKYKEEVRNAKLDDKIIFTGKVPWEEIPKYYQMAKVFVTASNSETQGLTIMEAMAGSLVTVCRNDKAFQETITDKVDGFFFDNKKEYIKLINDLYKSKELLEKTSLKARTNAELHSIDHFAVSVLKIYKKVIKNRKENFHTLKQIARKLRIIKKKEK
jgi:Glycosyltransferase